MDYQCYYCDQIFDSKEKLYEHVTVHDSPPDSKDKKSKTSQKKSD